MNRFAVHAALAAAIFCLLPVGCSLAPDMTPPSLDMPDVWSTTSNPESNDGETLSVQWWKRFEDPTLDRLIDEALANNRDLLAAFARVEYARAQLGLSRAEQFPQLSGQAAAQPTYVNGTLVTSQAPYNAAFSASWEIDLWGKYRNASAAAKARLSASRAAWAALRLTLAGQVASAYFQLRSLDLQLATAERTLQSRQAALAINQARYKAGLISELDLTQAQTVVETAQTALFRTRTSIESAEGALAALLGRSPRDVLLHRLERGRALEALPAPPLIPAGVPSTLLVRRPDLLEAEQNLAAANADVGVARAAWLPTISLTGALGVISPQLADLFRSPLDTHSYGGSAAVPLLDFGRVRAGVEAAQAQLKEQYAAYEQAILNAFSDVRGALAAQHENALVVSSLERQVLQFRQALHLARLRYDNGYSPYLDVLDAERSLFQSEMDLATARSDRLVSIVKVCMALGGGWQDSPTGNGHSAQGMPDMTGQARSGRISETRTAGADADDKLSAKTRP